MTYVACADSPASVSRIKGKPLSVENETISQADSEVNHAFFFTKVRHTAKFWMGEFTKENLEALMAALSVSTLLL